MKSLISILSFVAIFLLSSCSEKEVEPIHFGKDQCELCKMGIEDAKFGTELITEKRKSLQI
jgi:copper chaperone NosL